MSTQYAQPFSWLLAPPAWLDELTAAKAISDRHSSSLDQLALAQLIDTGGYDRHVRRCRHTYRRRRDRLQTFNSPEIGIQLSGIAAGMHAILTLPRHLDEPAATAAAARRGLAVEGLHSYRRGGPNQPPALVLGYGTPPDHAYRGALARLVAVLHGAGA